MNESSRTLTFVGAAALIALIAWATRPAPPAPVQSSAGMIVEAFDINDAESFKIQKYDADEQKLVTFEVAKEAGRWAIPSHDNYPADAQAQLQKVAGFFTGMKAIGSQQSDDPKQHGSFGVKQPTAETSGDGKEYGTVVSISDSSGKEIVNLIVGKPATAKSGEDDKFSGKSLRFVRKVGQDPVYVVEISSEAITTNFSDWIEQDLLKLNSFDVAKLDLHDYSLLPVQDADGSMALQLMRRMDTTVKASTEGGGWDLEKMIRYQGNKSLEGDLADDEELNKTKLDGVKTAVDDLKIVDVERKPEVLFKALKDEKLARDRSAQRELQQFGFFVQPEPGSQKLRIFASNGALSVSMKDGVQYQLYFGNPKSAEKGDSSKLNRYLMVSAQIDESMLPKPKLVPEDEPLGPETTDKPEGDKPEGDKLEEKQDKDDTSEKNDEAALKGKDDEKEPETKTDEEKKPDEEAAKKKREAIKKENKRKLDEYYDKRKKAETRVAELNSRFNDWFYVVSDDVYKKVQLGRADIVKDRDTAKEEGFGVDAFRKLEQGGVEGKAAASTPPPPPSGLPGGFPGGFPNN
jgi:hypothetical protein